MRVNDREIADNDVEYGAIAERGFGFGINVACGGIASRVSTIFGGFWSSEEESSVCVAVLLPRFVRLYKGKRC
jgi:hypothetical protein